MRKTAPPGDRRLVNKALSGRWPIAAILLLSFAVYLQAFVPRGWVPHDEGTLAQAAERVLAGQMPHVDFEDPYTGGLTRFYAGIFRGFGVELRHLRWVMFCAGVGAVVLTFLILSALLRPTAAGAGAWLAGLWSFPNYLAPLPSWWLLLLALIALWAMVNERKRGGWLRLSVIGLAVGASVAIKQTGVYIGIAVVWALLYDQGLRFGADRHATRAATFFTIAVALLGSVGAASVMGSRLLGPDGIYLFLPVAACAATLIRAAVRRTADGQRAIPVSGFALLLMSAAMPVAWVAWPYLRTGQMDVFLYSTLVLPTVRLTLAAQEVPVASAIILGVPLVLLLTLAAPSDTRARKAAIAASWATAVVLPFLALGSFVAYQLLWQGTRAAAALVPVFICFHLWTDGVQDRQRRGLLFACAVMLAWISFNQFPLAAPVYFAFTTPLVVIGCVAQATAGEHRSIHRLGPPALALGLFAAMGLNTGYIWKLGRVYERVRFDTPLDLPRAHLSVEAREAREYQQLVPLIQRHLGSGSLVAGPDAPELYFLTGQFSPTGAFFDFFDDASGLLANLSQWKAATVIAINHEPGFSPRLSEGMAVELRSFFPYGATIGHYEVRWR